MDGMYHISDQRARENFIPSSIFSKDEKAEKPFDVHEVPEAKNFHDILDKQVKGDAEGNQESDMCFPCDPLEELFPKSKKCDSCKWDDAHVACQYESKKVFEGCSATRSECGLLCCPTCLYKHVQETYGTVPNLYELDCSRQALEEVDMRREITQKTHCSDSA